jgi:prepilin-type N-terminal cleavage/methylation domain-containing protein
MKQQNQKGFSAIELLLVMLIVAVLGFTGYYVYHNQHTAKAVVVKTTSTSSPAAASGTSTAKPASYFTIAAWGVRAPYSGSLTLESNVTTSDGETYAYLSSSQLDASDPACAVTNGGYGGVITRYASTDMVQDEDGSTNQTPAQYISQNTDPGLIYAHIGNYYYFYTHPQGDCSGNAASNTIQSQTETVFETLVPILQAVPAS